MLLGFPLVPFAVAVVHLTAETVVGALADNGGSSGCIGADGACLCCGNSHLTPTCDCLGCLHHGEDNQDSHMSASNVNYHNTNMHRQHQYIPNYHHYQPEPQQPSQQSSEQQPQQTERAESQATSEYQQTGQPEQSKPDDQAQETSGKK